MIKEEEEEKKKNKDSSSFIISTVDHDRSRIYQDGVECFEICIKHNIIKKDYYFLK